MQVNRCEWASEGASKQTCECACMRVNTQYTIYKYVLVCVLCVYVCVRFVYILLTQIWKAHNFSAFNCYFIVNVCLLTCCESIFNYLPYAQIQKYDNVSKVFCVCSSSSYFVCYARALLPTKYKIMIWQQIMKIVQSMENLLSIFQTIKSTNSIELMCECLWNEVRLPIK